MNTVKNLALAALVVGLVALTPAWAQNRGENRGSLRNEIQRDRQELRNSRQQFRSDRRELREDRRELRQDLRSGASPEEIDRDKADIARSLEELRNSRRELREDRRELRRDLREYDRRHSNRYQNDDRWRENYDDRYYGHNRCDDHSWWHAYSWRDWRCDRDPDTKDRYP
jgi:septal ring factor EnvC (AmiA/AmiB activator)